MEPNVLDCANLILRTDNASLVETNNQGFSWYNIDLRQLLGDLYDRYSLFKLTFLSAEMNNIGSFTALNEGIVFLNMQGLEWDSSTYTYSEKTNTNTAKVGILFFVDPNNPLTSVPPFTNLGLTFRKTTPNCTIRIFFTKTTNGVDLSNKNFPAQQGFRFLITPIE